MQSQPSTWIVSPKWDAFWIFSAFWATALLLVVHPFYQMNEFGSLLTVLVFGRLLAMFHSWSTTYMVLWSGPLREARGKERKRYFYIPLALAFACFGLGYGVSETQYFDKQMNLGWEHWIWVVYLGLFWVGHFWHFGNQDFGVLSFYRTRAGDSSAESRFWDRRYATLMMFIIHPIVFFGVYGEYGNSFSHVVHKIMPFSEYLNIKVSMALALLSLPLSFFMLWRDWKNDKASWGHFIYLLLMASHPFFLILVASQFGLLYTVTYIWSHWTIAVGLVSFMNTNRFKQNQKAMPVLRHIGIMSVIVLPLFFATYNFMPWAVFNKAAQIAANQIAQATYENHWYVGFFLGFFLFEQILHYYCDRVLFRFRLPEIQKSIVPLLRS